MAVCRSREGKDLVESEKVKISSTSDGLYTLRLSHLTDQDSGQYTIKALNDAGQTSCTATLLVHGTQPRQLVPVVSLVMVALCNRADHYIFTLFLSSFFFFFFLA